MPPGDRGHTQAMSSERSRMWSQLHMAALRDATVLVALYTIPALRPLRRWYWRLSIAAVAIGAVFGLAGAISDHLRGNSPVSTQIESAARGGV